MTMAASLLEAASLSYAQLDLAWAALTLKSKYAAFIASTSPLFSDAIPNDRTVGNWYVLLNALSVEMSSTIADVSEKDFDAAVEYMYRLTYATAIAVAQSRISAATGVAVLAAWNTNFGT